MISVTLAILIISGCVNQPVKPTGTPAPTTTLTAAPTPAEEQTVKLSTGDYITDSKGMTLYIFSQDVAGNSKCSGPCSNNWPLFYADDIVPSAGLNSSDFGEIKRADGKEQTTFKGWPLYYFRGDVNPGDRKGEGVIGLWFVAKPDYSVLIANKDNLTYLVDGMGKTLYKFASDKPGVSNCSGACSNNWPAFYAENIVAPSTLNTSDFGVITNSAGTEQTTYKQMPLYYFVNDTRRGDTNGQGKNNVWSVAQP